MSDVLSVLAGQQFEWDKHDSLRLDERYRTRHLPLLADQLTADVTGDAYAELRDLVATFQPVRMPVRVDRFPGDDGRPCAEIPGPAPLKTRRDSEPGRSLEPRGLWFRLAHLSRTYVP